MRMISLILTTFNSKDNFLKTYSSICKQTYPNIEIIVVDGNSSDGTREAIEKCAYRDQRIRWISEKDAGIYDAMNKGLHMAQGDIIAFFNDEFLSDHAVEKYISAIEKDDSDGVHSDLIYRDSNGKIIRRWKMGEGDIRKGWMPGHPTLYLRKEIYQRYGGYKKEYKCAADYEFMVRILKDGKVKLSYIPQELIAMFYGGTSSSGIKAYMLSFSEGMRALKSNGIKGALWISILRTIRVLKQF